MRFPFDGLIATVCRGLLAVLGTATANAQSAPLRIGIIGTGKIVLDTGNPIERRDGAMAREALRKGSGVASAGFLPGARLVRAFNCIPAASLANRADRRPERIAIPLAGDDRQALEVAQRLVRDAGFDPVVIGGLESARLFELGAPLARGDATAAELERAAAGLRGAGGR